MKNLLLLPLLLLLSCGGMSSPPQPGPVDAERTYITAIEVRSYGGQMGFASCLRLTADSISFIRTTEMAPEQNDSFRRRANPASWQALIGDLDLEGVRKAAEGESKQPTDGIDTEIMVLTNRDTISRRNAYQSLEWQKLLLKTQLFLNE